MSGNLLKAARADSKRYITYGGFQQNITLATPNGSTKIELTGLATNHNISFDTDGNPVNSKNVHISIVESNLIEKDYPYKNSRAEISLIDHLVQVPDSNGDLENYIIKENFPNQTLGIIPCILGDYNPR